jgi:hypothetical protein
MSLDQPHVSPEEVQTFAFSVGKAIQNYGTIEYLVNHLVAFLVADALLVTTIVQLGISKRLDLLSTLVERRKDLLAKQGWTADDLFERTKAAFRERNKIAHNPYVVQESKHDKQITVGIQVVRYHKVGTKDEWIDQAQLDTLVSGSRELLVRFNQLLECCKAQ